MLKTLSKRERNAVKYYDVLVRKGDTSDNRVWMDGFTAPIFRRLGENDEVVDIGCRIGRFVPLLPQLGISKYLGIDPSAESIRYCQRTFAEVDYCSVQFEVSEARLLGKMYAERFSGFIMAAVLMHIPRTDLPTVLASVRGCLKSGAPGFFSTPFAYEDEELEVVNSQGLDLTLYTEEELVAGFVDAGFTFENLMDVNNMILGHVMAI